MTDLYVWLKAFHVAAVLTFVAGVLGASVFLAALPAATLSATTLKDHAPEHAGVARALHRWDRAVTTPAMLALWALGLTLALRGGWLRDGWLVAKLALVVAVSGVHGVQSAKLRRMAGGAAVAVPSPLLAPLVVGSVVAIAILVVAKPF